MESLSLKGGGLARSPLANTVMEAAVGLTTSVIDLDVNVGVKACQGLHWKHEVYYSFLLLCSFVPRWCKNNRENFGECVSFSVIIGNSVALGAAIACASS